MRRVTQRQFQLLQPRKRRNPRRVRHEAPPRRHAEQRDPEVVVGVEEAFGQAAVGQATVVVDFDVAGDVAKHDGRLRIPPVVENRLRVGGQIRIRSNEEHTGQRARRSFPTVDVRLHVKDLTGRCRRTRIAL